MGSIRHALTGTLVAALSVFGAAQGMAGPPVIELFTSQGCSSCPPADELLGTLADRDDIIALSLPVDYWDYLGWKDSFATSQNTARQKSYAHARGDRSIYTPQIVVNGVRDIVGSDAGELDAALKSSGSQIVDLDVTMGPRAIDVAVPADPTGQRRHGVVWLAGFSGAEPVTIGRGENAGRKVVYHNVVRTLVRIGDWDGQPTHLKVDRVKVWKKDMDGCAVIIQEDVYGGTGPVLAAALVRE